MGNILYRRDKKSMLGKKNKISNIWILFVERLLSAFNWKLFAIVIATYPQHQLKIKL